MDNQSIFETIPGYHLILKPEPPRFQVLHATNDLLKAIRLQQNELVGKSVFDIVATEHFGLPEVNQNHLADSLTKVIELKSEYRIADQRYEVPHPTTGKPEWRVMTLGIRPILDPQGGVGFIILTLEDITHAVREQDATDLANFRWQESDKRFKKMISRAPFALLVSRGEELVIESLNPPMLQIINKESAEEVVGKKMLDVIPELESQRIYQIVQKVQTSGIPFKGEEVPVDLEVDGRPQRFYFNFSYNPMYENGQITGVLHIAVDVTSQVTSRMQMELEKLEAQKQKRIYETITSNTPDLIYVFDLNYRFTYVNKALLEMWGSTWEKSVGKGLRENGYEEWHAQMHEREIDQIVATKKPIRGQVAFPHSTLGKRIYDYILVPVINQEGMVEAVAGTTRDVTELKLTEQAIRESENRFRNLADESPMFVFILDADPLARVNYWNKTWLDYTGQTMEEAIGRAWDGPVHPDDTSVAMEYYTPAFEKREPYLIPAVRVKRYDGVYRWHSFKGNPRYLPNGEFNGYVGVGFDIHEQKSSADGLEEIVARRTEELQHANNELQRSNRNLEEFAHAASHDLKEPIRKIHFFTHQLKEQLRERLNEAELRTFNRIENATERMGNLVDDLLLYSEVSEKPVETERIDLNAKIRRVLEDVELAIQDKKATIHVDPLPTVMGYRRQLQQLFQNLIGNALKYSKADVPPQIDITARQTEKDGIRYNVISVKDNGIGFDEQYGEKIFQMFARLHGKNEYGGTGVGLSIVKKVIENHQGFITVKSQPGEGSVFEIGLPEL